MLILHQITHIQHTSHSPNKTNSTWAKQSRKNMQRNEKLRKMERMGFDFNVSGISIGGINFGNVVRGIEENFGNGREFQQG